MVWNVITLHSEEFVATCQKLQRIIEKDNFIPDVVLGIRSGGEWVARELFPNIPHEYTELRRPGSQRKKKFERIVQFLPYSLLNAIRISEALLVGQKSRRTSFCASALPTLPTTGKLLVVDDAVDSGATLRTILECISSVYPSLEVRSASITVTTVSPAAYPEYFVYNNHTLIRFPWSIDMKQKPQF